MVEYDEEPNGPYNVLTFQDVPQSIMPMAPAMVWKDLHDLANRLFRKLGRQADRQKSVLGVAADSASDGERVVGADDGKAIRMDRPEGAREYNFGGVSPENLVFFGHVKDLYSYMAGNLDALGGLGPQAETLGQEELISQGARSRMGKMSARVASFAQREVTSIARLAWENPMYADTVEIPIPGTDIKVKTEFGSRERTDPFGNFTVNVEPHSMSLRTPQQRLAMIGQVIERYYAPLLPMWQEQGIQLDGGKLFDVLSRYGNLPELDEIFVRVPPSKSENPQQGGGSAKPTKTTREYVRRNVSGVRTNQGQTDTLQRLLAGSGVSDREASQAGIGGG